MVSLLFYTMPHKYDKPKTFQPSALDKEIMEYTRYDIDLWARGYFDGQCFPFQRYFYHAPQHDKLLVAGIRTGKSRLASMAALHYTQFNPYTRFLNTSISSEQAKIVFQNCLEYCSMPKFQHWVEHVQSSPYPLIRLVNGSELWFRSIGYEAELIRGFEFDFINVDEAAYITRPQAITTLKGRLLGINPLTGRPRANIFWMISSPKGSGWLSERWKKGDPIYKVAEPLKYLSLRATIWDNPLLDRQQIEDTMADYSDAMIQQEFYGEFIDSYDAVFPYKLVMEGCNDEYREVKWIYDQIRFWNAQQQADGKERENIRRNAGLTEDISHYECEPQAGHRYVASWDFGKKPTSKGRNACVGIVIDITHEPWTMIAFRFAEGMGYVEAKSEAERWHRKYSHNGAICSTIIDATGKGDVVQEFIEREKTIDDIEGFVYTGANKPLLIDSGKIAIERGLVRYPFIRKLVDQLSNYDRFDKDIPQDIVMAFCQACWKARETTRISNAVPMARVLSATYGHSGMRSQYARRNPRYVESRLARRAARLSAASNRRGKRAS